MTIGRNGRRQAFFEEAGAGDGTGGAGSGGQDWRAMIAGDDTATLEFLKPVEDPKALVAAFKSQNQWRESIAGDNADALKTLERFASPKALWDSYAELRGKVSKGELKANTPFPAKGTTEQQAAWRQENGVPEAPDKYDLKLPAGVVVGEADKPVIEAFQKFAHEKNLPAGVVSDVVAWQFQQKVAAEEARRADFDAKKTETAAELGREWGPEFKANMNKIQGVLDATIPGDQGELKTLIKNAIDSNPHFARHYAAIALELNPAGTLVPGDRGANEGSVVDGIKEIEGVMAKNRSKYDKDQTMQTRYRDLLGAYQKMTGKEWGR